MRIKLWHIILVVLLGIVFFLWFRGCGVDEPRGARELFKYSRRAFEIREWDRLYEYSGTEFREKYIPIQRRHLEYLLRQTEVEGIDAKTAITFSEQQVFRVWMEVYSQTDEGSELIERAEEITIKEIEDLEGKKIIRFEAPLKIPGDFTAVVAAKEEGRWRIIDLDN